MNTLLIVCFYDPEYLRLLLQCAMVYSGIWCEFCPYYRWRVETLESLETGPPGMFLSLEEITAWTCIWPEASKWDFFFWSGQKRLKGFYYNFLQLYLTKEHGKVVREMAPTGRLPSLPRAINICRCLEVPVKAEWSYLRIAYHQDLIIHLAYIYYAGSNLS